MTSIWRSAAGASVRIWEPPSGLDLPRIDWWRRLSVKAGRMVLPMYGFSAFCNVARLLALRSMVHDWSRG